MATGLPRLVGQTVEFVPMDRSVARRGPRSVVRACRGRRGDRALRAASRQNDPQPFDKATFRS